MYTLDFFPEKEIRKDKILKEMALQKVEAILLTDNANVYYTSGRVFNGFTYINANGDEIFFVKKPVGLNGKDVVYIRKQEDIPAMLIERGIHLPNIIGLEYDSITYSEITRLENVFSNAKSVNASSILRKARAVKTPFEIGLLKTNGIHHESVYRHIEKVFREGMTDIELQIEIERQARLEGSLGQFRVSGQSMEIFMGSLLCGDNADNPTPYDFAMGGAGINSSLPVGANGTTIKPGLSVMVDIGGNFTGYMTDMTRTFYTQRKPGELAEKAHNISIEIAHEIAKSGKPGVAASELYNIALQKVKDANLEDFFMGHKQKAAFVGHGVGIEINELPVIAPKSRDILEVGNVIAIEPKFVIPGVGAVGIENTYIVTDNGMECITNFPENLNELF